MLILLVYVLGFSWMIPRVQAPYYSPKGDGLRKAPPRYVAVIRPWHAFVKNCWPTSELLRVPGRARHRSTLWAIACVVAGRSTEV